MMKKRSLLRIGAFVLCLLMLAGCAQKAEETVYVDQAVLDTVELEDEAVALSEAPAALPVLLSTENQAEYPLKSHSLLRL